MIDAPRFWRPEDLTAWQRWQRAQWAPSRRLAHAGRGALATVRGRGEAPEAGLRLVLPPGEVHTLVGVESAGPTQRAALVRPALALARSHAGAPADPTRDPAEGLGWVLPAGAVDALLPDLPAAAALTVHAIDAGLVAERLAGLRRVLVAGEYLPAGRAAVRWARERGARVGVVQHGLLAVTTPPVPRDAVLYAFTQRDADWWTQGRADVEAVAVGSALLQDARRSASHSVADASAGRDAGPGVFLGQLHGAELPRSDFARAAQEYVRATGAVYRPHPAERDRLSRAQHESWRQAGLRIDDAAGPLAATSGPVAAVFSTGILEAAQAGRPAWAVHPEPPAWLEGFWERYGITRWRPGVTPEPTPPLHSPTQDPAAAIAAHFWKDSA